MKNRLVQRMASAWRSVTLLWLSGVVASWTMARPISQTLATSAADLPHGDAELFSPGGFTLLEVVARSKGTLEPLLFGSLWELVLAFSALLVPLAFAVHELRALLPPCSRLAGASLALLATKSWPRFAVLGALALLAQAVCLALALLLVLALENPLVAWLGAEHAAWLEIAVAMSGCLPAWAVGVLRDVARARSTGNAEGVSANVKVAIQIGRVHWRRCALTSLGTILGSALLVTVAAYLTTRFDVSHPGVWRVVGVALVHQSALLGIAALRVSWIAACVRLADDPTSPAATRPRPRVDRSARSDAPAGPSSDPNASLA